MWYILTMFGLFRNILCTVYAIFDLNIDMNSRDHYYCYCGQFYHLTHCMIRSVYTCTSYWNIPWYLSWPTFMSLGWCNIYSDIQQLLLFVFQQYVHHGHMECSGVFPIYEAMCQVKNTKPVYLLFKCLWCM